MNQQTNVIQIKGIDALPLILKQDNPWLNRALFPKFLTQELCNPLDDWLDWFISTTIEWIA